MYILDGNGELHEGVALTGFEVEVRTELLNVLHQKLCGGKFHNDWDRKYSGPIACEIAVTYFITRFELRIRKGFDLVADAMEAERENAPTELVEPPAPPPIVMAEEPEVGF